ncbi:hypothetical protein QBC34DRAFT_474324 [Podospora aff. communis PSN243]|uniref:Uncharacterized protein n=1 Tax=Podospora aff. communis PSN243 TaxID=3040156 RepID=A0AAV9G9I4_9PEZI|nr:hypothetical protein QBC34DRAFT_474324 [Podospora aff. communis PSN243]
MTIVQSVFMLRWTYGRVLHKLRETEAFKRVVDRMPIPGSWRRKMRELGSEMIPITWLNTPGWFSVVFVPFTLVTVWAATWGIAQSRRTTAGWTDVNLTWCGPLLLMSSSFLADEGTGSWRWICVLGLALVSVFNVAAVLAIVVQRLRAVNDFGTVAYNITNTNGCAPQGDISFLARGARSGDFKTIQAIQAFCSLSSIPIIHIVVLALTIRAMTKMRQTA